MKIYIASSWKNAREVRELAEMLQQCGFEVYDFTDERKHFSFNLNDLTNASEIEYVDFLKNVPESKKAFDADKGGLDWADIVIMFLPCGRSSLLEFGYGVGTGKNCFIYGDLPLGEYECMYHFADGWFHKHEINLLVEKLQSLPVKGE